MRYSSGVSDALTSTRLMIQSPNSASSRMPRNVVYSMWLWQLTKPGMMIDRPVSTTAAPGWSAIRRGAGPTATMRPSPPTATPPSGRTGAATGSTQSAR